MNLSIIDAAYHRNGVGGEPFYVVLFDDRNEGRMVATTFPESTDDGEPDWDRFSGRTAVLKVEELAKGNVAFAQGNSWRGDRYEAALYPKLKAFLRADQQRKEREWAEARKGEEP